MCRPDGRHVLNNQGTDDYVLTFMYIGKIPVENGTPEETEEEAKEALEEANLLENDQKL